MTPGAWGPGGMDSRKQRCSQKPGAEGRGGGWEMPPLPASSLRPPSPEAPKPHGPAAGGGFAGVRRACRGSKVWLRAAPGPGPCHRSLLSGSRSVSGPPAAFAFPATDTGGQLHFLLPSRVTFSSSRGSGQAALQLRWEAWPRGPIWIWGDERLRGPRNTLLPSRHTPPPRPSCPWLQPAVFDKVPLPHVDTKCTPIPPPTHPPRPSS